MAGGGRGRGPTCARAERGWAPQQLQQLVGAGIWAGLWPAGGGACTGAGLGRVLARWGGGASGGGTWTGLGLVGSWLAGGGAWLGQGAGLGRGRGRGSPEEGRSLGRAEEPAGRRGGDQTGGLSGGRSCSSSSSRTGGRRLGGRASPGTSRGRAGAAPRPGRLRPRGEAPCARRDQQHEQRLQQPRGGRGGLLLHRQDLLLQESASGQVPFGSAGEWRAPGPGVGGGGVVGWSRLHVSHPFRRPDARLPAGGRGAEGGLCPFGSRKVRGSLCSGRGAPAAREGGGRAGSQMAWAALLVGDAGCGLRVQLREPGGVRAARGGSVDGPSGAKAGFPRRPGCCSPADGP